MSQKNTYTAQTSQISQAHAIEYKIIKHDLIKVVGLNALYLAGVLALYYFNTQSHFLDKAFSKLFNF
jgi:hypothetical protein